MSDQPDQPDHMITGTPRWVKVFGIIFIVLILLFVILHLFGGGRFGPGRHMPGEHTPQVENERQRQ